MSVFAKILAAGHCVEYLIAQRLLDDDEEHVLLEADVISQQHAQPGQPGSPRPRGNRR